MTSVDFWQCCLFLTIFHVYFQVCEFFCLLICSLLICKMLHKVTHQYCFWVLNDESSGNVRYYVHCNFHVWRSMATFHFLFTPHDLVTLGRLQQCFPNLNFKLSLKHRISLKFINFPLFSSHAPLKTLHWLMCIFCLVFILSPLPKRNLKLILQDNACQTIYVYPFNNIIHDVIPLWNLWSCLIFQTYCEHQNVYNSCADKS